MVDAAEDRYRGANKADSYAIIAMAVHKQHPQRAKSLLRKAFEIIGSSDSNYKDRITFKFLRYAQTVDPESTGEYWWRAVSYQGGLKTLRSNQPPELELQARSGHLAILLHLYGRFPKLETELTEPLFEYWESIEPHEAFGPGSRGRRGGIDFRESMSALAAMALHDPERSVTLMKNWWPFGYARFNRSPDSAWLVVAEMLAYQELELSRLISKRVHHQWPLGDDYLH